MPFRGMPILRASVIAIGTIALASLALLLTGTRLLVWERHVEPGQSFVVQDYGDLGENGQASLVCWYFTGRSVLSQVFWYSSNNILGRDSCPFLDRQD